MPIGHLGVNVPDLAVAKTYYDQVMPALGYEAFVSAEDELAYQPADGRRGTFLFFYPTYFATFWLDPFGFKLEAVCHHDRD